jgi:hypothetical protein
VLAGWVGVSSNGGATTLDVGGRGDGDGGGSNDGEVEGVHQHPDGAVVAHGEGATQVGQRQSVVPPRTPHLLHHPAAWMDLMPPRCVWVGGGGLHATVVNTDGEELRCVVLVTQEAAPASWRRLWHVVVVRPHSWGVLGGGVPYTTCGCTSTGSRLVEISMESSGSGTASIRSR